MGVNGTQTSEHWVWLFTTGASIAKGSKKVSERAKGDSEVNASMTEGEWDVCKLQQTKLDVSRLP